MAQSPSSFDSSWKVAAQLIGWAHLLAQGSVVALFYPLTQLLQINLGLLPKYFSHAEFLNLRSFAAEPRHDHMTTTQT